ncbi:hypothetical protein [Ochrobactrum sp. EDr1-4]
MLWRAVDRNGYVLDEIVQSSHNTQASKRLLLRFRSNKVVHQTFRHR